eukprot:gene5490-6653_t
MSTDMLNGIDDPKHLIRERALYRLQDALAAGEVNDCQAVTAIESKILILLEASDWEGRQGGFLSAKALLKYDDNNSFKEKIMTYCEKHLEDTEARVRLAAGETLRTLAEKHGVEVYQRLQALYHDRNLIGSLERHFDREPAEDAEGALEEEEQSSDVENSEPGSPQYLKKTDLRDNVLMANTKDDALWAWRRLKGVFGLGASEAQHDTEGWKCLETSFKALQCVIEGTGEPIATHLGAHERGLIYRALQHPNRFVRETGFLTMRSLCSILRGADLLPQVSELSGWLATGLSDNWSQVRYASSVATRAFVEGLEEESKDECFPTLVPRMCLNRYYVAEGVRLYSQETWRTAMGDTGRQWVAKCAPEVVTYYVEASQANNHAVREAACACIAELMSKIDRAAVAPHVPTLLKALVDCFKDESWPVRDAACSACGNCVIAFPEESRSVLEELYELWFSHLWDNIWSVRETSAIALANVARAYGEEAIPRIAKLAKERLPMALIQPRDSKRFGTLENSTTFGVAKQSQEDGNCGSLAPKLRRGGGCMDHGFSREKEPWEASDGAIYLLRELAAVAPEAVLKLLPELVEVSRVDHRSFQHYYNLLETLWKQLPAIAKHVGKRPFKRYLEDFLEPLFSTLTCGQQLAEAAAG